MNFLIFLDFDGVLHAHSGPHSERFYFLPRFEAVMRDFPSVMIVIASAWNLRDDIETLRSYFSIDIQPRVIGASTFTEAEALRYRGRRYRAYAAARFRESNGFVANPWVALDDEPSFWAPGDPLIVCADGFCLSRELTLRMVLRGELPANGRAIAVMECLTRDYGAEFSRARQFFQKHRATLDEESHVKGWIERICSVDAESRDLLYDREKR